MFAFFALCAGLPLWAGRADRNDKIQQNAAFRGSCRHAGHLTRIHRADLNRGRGAGRALRAGCPLLAFFALRACLSRFALFSRYAGKSRHAAFPLRAGRTGRDDKIEKDARIGLSGCDLRNRPGLNRTDLHRRRRAGDSPLAFRPRLTGRAGDSLRACGSLRTGSAAFALFALRPCRALQAYFSGSPLRTGLALGALLTLHTLLSLWSPFAALPALARNAWDSLRALRPRISLRASRTGTSGNSLRPHDTLRAPRTYVPSNPLQTARPLQAGHSARSHRAGKAALALRPALTRRSLRTRRALQSGRPCHAPAAPARPASPAGFRPAAIVTHHLCLLSCAPLLRGILRSLLSIGRTAGELFIQALALRAEIERDHHRKNREEILP